MIITRPRIISSALSFFLVTTGAKNAVHKVTVDKPISVTDTLETRDEAKNKIQCAAKTKPTPINWRATDPLIRIFSFFINNKKVSPANARNVLKNTSSTAGI